MNETYESPVCAHIADVLTGVLLPKTIDACPVSAFKPGMNDAYADE